MNASRTKVVLVIPSSERVKVLRSYYNPPLGLLSIGTNILQSTKNTDLIIVNGELYPNEETCLKEITSFNPDKAWLSLRL